MILLTADSVYRDYNTQGVPTSGDFKPRKAELRAFHKRVMNQSGQSVTRNTFTALSAVTPPTENYMGIVLDDPDATKNGYYSRVAAAWVWERGFPDTLTRLTVTGGTANAVQASASSGVNPSDVEVFYIDVATPNAGNVTVAINGASAIPAYNINGDQFAPGEWDGRILLSNEGTSLKALVDPAAAASAAASAAAAAASAALAAAGLGKPFDNNAAAEAYDPTPNPDPSFIETASWAVLGDGGERQLDGVGSVPSHDMYLTIGSGGVFAYTKRTIRASQAGAFPSASVSSRAEFNSALEYLEEVGGGCLEIDHDEFYYIAGGSIDLSGFSSHIRIENKAGGVLRAASGLSVPVFKLASGVSSPGTGRLTAYDLKIDNSLGAYSVGVQSCTGLELSYLDQADLYNYECLGGYNTLTQTGGGDSGISTVGCRAVVLYNPDIHNQPDAAFYPSWDNTGTVDGYFEVNGGRYKQNQFILTGKRNLKEIVWNGGEGDENRGGLVTAWVNNGGWVHPARLLKVNGLVLRKTLANLVTVKGPNGKLLVDGLKVIDIGYERNGTGNVGANAIGILTAGVSGAVVRNSLFQMDAWTSVSEVAFANRPDTDSGTTYSGGGHSMGGNVLRGFNRYATGGGSADVSAASTYSDETFDNVGASPFGSTFNVASPVEWIDLATPTIKRMRLNGTTYQKAIVGRFAPQAVTLTSIGTLAAGATSALQTLSMPGLTTSDDAIISRLTSNLTAAPGIAISFRTTTDAVQYYFRNNTASSFDFTGQQIRVSF